MHRILEAGKFHGLFIADMLGVYDVYKGPENIDIALPGAAQFPISDPFLSIAAMAAVTKSLSFGITSSTTYEQPFTLARRFSTLDHLTKGRVAWNIVTSYLPSAVGLDTEVPHDERYQIADEYLDVTYKLWEGSLALFGGWYGIDLDKYGDDEDFRFAAKRNGPIKGIQGMIDAWSSTIPGTENVAWTKSRIAKELAIGSPHPKAIGPRRLWQICFRSL
jgi:alkanesulfonate monooxygenase SsuD/methylene tetrahydromethanopterin reductase-like flavin-dependent oxidoreductase (luciferase family)